MVLSHYPEYQPFNTEWLHKIPKHWSKQIGKAIFNEKNVKNTGMKQEQVLSLSYGRILKKPAKKLHGLVPVSFEGYQIIEPGDVIMRSIDLQNDRTSLRFGIARDHGIITSAYLCLQTKAHLVREYAYQVLNAYDLMKVFYGFGSGLRQNISFSDFKYLQIPVPPRPEQDQIVAYLRAQDAHIARFIKAKRELIKLLTEQKLRIIDHAVTRGLDASVALKPSGIEWLGEVPEHWDLRRLKFLASNTTCQTTTKTSDEIYLAMEHVQSWTGVARPLEGDVEFASTVKRFIADDVLFGKLRPYLAKVTRAKCNGVCVSEFLVLRARKEIILPAYLEQLLRCKEVIDLINSSTAGAKMPRADWTFIGNVRLPIPRKDEQEAILSHIEIETKDLDAAIARAEDEIKLIREYRDRLIADVVTGQVDVRGWQPGPDNVVSDDELAALGDEDANLAEEDADGDG